MGFIITANGAWWILKFLLRRRHELMMARRRGVVVVVTGGTSGLGFETVRAVCQRLDKIESQDVHTVIFTSRKQEKGLLALELLRHPRIRVGFHKLDQCDEDSIRVFSQSVTKRFGQVDILVNIAGILPSFPSLATKKEAERVLDVNYYGTKAVTAALLPLMAPGGRIITVVSGLAELAIRWMSNEMYKKLFSPFSKESDIDAVVQHFAEELSNACAGYNVLYAELAYPFTQAARIALTQVLARMDDCRNITVYSFSPGWCRTASGGLRAPFSAMEGAEEAVFAAFDANSAKLQGSFFIGRKAAKFGDVDAISGIQSEHFWAGVEHLKNQPKGLLPAV